MYLLKEKTASFESSKHLNSAQIVLAEDDILTETYYDCTSLTLLLLKF